MRPLLLLRVLFALAAATSLRAAAPAAEPPVILFVHGAWGGGWQFAKVDPLLRAQGFDVRRATLTGLGERSHLASRDIGLATHIEDVVNLILFERLQGVILVGHSYGGMVIAGVADRIPDRIARLVYLDAFVPENGESLMGLRAGRPGGADLERMTRDGFVVPTWVPPGKPLPVDVPHPLKTFTDPIVLTNPAATRLPATYILTVDPGRRAEDDDFFSSAQRARARGWTVLTMEADHNPHWRKPAETAALLAGLR